MRITTRRTVLGMAGGLLAARSPPARAEGSAIAGGGSSFVRPIMTGWVTAARAKGMDLTYQVLGTGDAQNQLLANEIDFAAVELPMPPNMLELGQIVQFPIAFGAMTFVVNIDGVEDGALRLSAPLIGSIYAGSIKQWSDPQIAAANPGLKLPDTEIHPVFLARPDGSQYSTSTTLVRYLMARNPDWAQKFANAIKTRWAIGAMVPSAEAMIPVIQARQGSIGYMALGTALGTKLPKVKLLNKNGEMVKASLDTLRAAIARIDWIAVPDMVVSAMDLPGAGVWPLVLPTYAMLPRVPHNKERGKLAWEFLEFALKEAPAEASNALPLPPEARDKALKLLTSG